MQASKGVQIRWLSLCGGRLAGMVFDGPPGLGIWLAADIMHATLFPPTTPLRLLLNLSTSSFRYSPPRDHARPRDPPSATIIENFNLRANKHLDASRNRIRKSELSATIFEERTVRCFNKLLTAYFTSPEPRLALPT